MNESNTRDKPRDNLTIGTLLINRCWPTSIYAFWCECWGDHYLGSTRYLWTVRKTFTSCRFLYISASFSPFLLHLFSLSQIPPSREYRQSGFIVDPPGRVYYSGPTVAEAGCPPTWGIAPPGGANQAELSVYYTLSHARPRLSVRVRTDNFLPATIAIMVGRDNLDL